MTLNKKILAAAIVGGLFGAAANAQVVLNPIAPETNAPVTYASEINTAGTLAQRTLTGTAANSITVNSGYAFSSGEVRYARVECTNVRFLSSGALSATPAGAAFGSLNGLNSSAITFSVTSPVAGITIGTDFNIPATYELLNNSAGSCTYSLYDQPSQAQAGGTAGRIYTATGNFIASAASYTFTAPTAETATANVEASPSFTAFVAATAPSQTTATTARLAQLTSAHVGNLLPGGAAVTALTDLMIAPVRITVTGDFTAAANSDSTYTGAALSRVWINSDGANCTSSGDVGDIQADQLSATSARFTIPTPFALTAQNLCFAPRSGTAIPASTYTATFTPTAINAGFVTPAVGPRNTGEIVRNGTQLQAQFAQVPAGWTSRIVLTNTGSVARPYTITAQTEAGITATLGTAASGTVPANGTIVLNTSDIATFAGTAPRGTLNVTVAGPNTQLQGLYQIVNGQTGSIANTALVRPGTN